MSLTKESDSEKNPDQKKDVSLENALAQIVRLTEQVNSIQKNASSPPGGGLTDADIAKIAAIVAQTQKVLNPKELNYEAGIYEEEIPLDDWDEKGVRFCAPYVGYLINDDRRKGQVVRLPYGKKEIFFTYAATRKVQVGKNFQLAPLSVYRSQSKKETEWLRNHSFYGFLFYESSNEAMNADASKAIRLANIMKMLQPLELHDLYRRCKDYGVAISEDGPAMRANIAVKMIEKEIEGEKQASMDTLAETYKSAKLLGREER